MNRQQLIQFFEETTRKMVEVCKAKNADYAGGAGDQDAFANFSRIESLGIASTEQGFLTRMTDKLMRINSLTKKNAQVKAETIEDTLLDLANYSILFAAYLKSKSLQEKQPAEMPEQCDHPIGTREMSQGSVFCNKCGRILPHNQNAYIPPPPHVEAVTLRSGRK